MCRCIGLRHLRIATIAVSSAILLAGASPALAAAPLTLEAFVGRVLEENLELRVADVEAEAAADRAQATAGWLNPSVSWTRESIPGGSNLAQSQDVVLLSLPLALSGRLGLEQTAAERQAQAERWRRRRTQASLRWRATWVFFENARAHERVRILEDSVARATELDGIIAARARAGEAAGYDRIRLELERTVLADQLEGAKLELARARVAARQLLGPGDDRSLHLSGQLGTASLANVELEVLLADLESRHAGLRALAVDADAARQAAEAMARQWIPDPTVAVGVQHTTGGADAELGYVVGLSVPLPLFQRGQEAAARAKGDARIAEARRSALLHRARVRLAASARELTAQRSRTERHKTEVLTRVDALITIARRAYAAGGTPLLMLVDAERSAREAKLVAIEHAFKLRSAENEVQFVAGVYDAGEGDVAP